jgi:hypothetical protein
MPPTTPNPANDPNRVKGTKDKPVKLNPADFPEGTRFSKITGEPIKERTEPSPVHVLLTAIQHACDSGVTTDRISDLLEFALAAEGSAQAPTFRSTANALDKASVKAQAKSEAKSS